MKTKYLFRVLRSILLGAVILSASCEDDDKPGGTPYFLIEESPTGLSVGTDAKTQAYVIRSNRPWTIVAQSEEKWARSFPEEGEDDGIFKIIVEKNNTFDTRVMNFAFFVGGNEQPTLFRVEQEANVPYITVTESSAGIAVPAAGSEVTIHVEANVDWTYSVSNGNWLQEASVNGTSIVLVAGPNEDPEREAVLTVSSAGYPNLSKTVTITQTSLSSAVMEENFSWLNYGSTKHYDTAGEKRYDTWTTDERSRGWTSTPADGTQQLCYARPGFVKLGKTNFGGDLISPKLSALKGTQNVIVSFKACGYISGGSDANKGAKDDNELYVSVIGPGTVSVAKFIIDNYPYSKYEEARPDEYPADYNPWDPSVAERSFTITGATSETQVKFMGGSSYNLSGIGQGKNRIFLDDIKVVLE